MSDFSYTSILEIPLKEKKRDKNEIYKTIAASGSLHIKVRKILLFGVNEID